MNITVGKYCYVGASYPHNQITSASLRDIGAYLKGKGCNIFGSNLRIYTQPLSFYTYPDAVLTCGEPSFLDKEFDTILNPGIILKFFRHLPKMMIKQ